MTVAELQRKLVDIPPDTPVVVFVPWADCTELVATEANRCEYGPRVDCVRPLSTGRINVLLIAARDHSAKP